MNGVGRRGAAILTALVLAAASLPAQITAATAPLGTIRPVGGAPSVATSVAPSAQATDAGATVTSSIGGNGPLITFSDDPGTATSTADPSGSAAPFVPGRAIVAFRSTPSFLAGSGRVTPLAAQRGVYLVESPPGLSVAAAIAQYRAQPNVAYAEPDYVVTTADTIPADPLWANQWDMTKIAAPAAWDVTTGSASVVVAIVDTGIAFTHPDLTANIWADPADPTIHGYTCMGGACVAGGFDDHGHGTHVAGTIGAATNNATGIAGLNWNVRLLAVKFLSSGGSGSISDAVLGFGLLRDLKLRGVNIRVTNNSWGGGGYSQALKDAMAALEETPGAPSTIDVCAAGNSGVNADFTPMYPAAYDNRGIVSVLASDANDAGAYFTNYGLASVDLAAPGVTIFSTEASGTCSLCDPSGYRNLSGTSMASPHVAGVAAAMLSLHPALSAAQARDALLDPASYDRLTDARGASTSTGGRLNYAKVLANAGYYANPTLNGFPTVTVGPDVRTAGGGAVSFTQTASDPDGDPLRAVVGRGPAANGSAWLLGWQVNQLLPTTPPFTAPYVARTVAMPYDTAVADGRGGGASGRNWAVIDPTSGAGGAPTGVLTVPTTGAVNVAVPISFVGSDPEGGPVAWDLFASTMSSSSGSCCRTGTSASITFGSPGVYRISVQAADRELNTSPRYTALISIGGAAGSPPIAEASVSVQSGPAPLTVSFDMSASSDTDGSIANYFNGCGGGFATGQKGPLSSCTFSTPGTYWILLHVTDDAGNMGTFSQYVVVTPSEGGTPPPPDTTAPTVAITSPASGATVTGTVSLQATAADETGGSGVRQVDWFIDGSSTPLGSSSASPYTVAWATDGLAPGTHSIRAQASDVSGNTRSVTIGVTVPAPTLPTASLSPSGSVTIARKSSLSLSATTNTPTYGVARVDFLVGGSVVCSDTTAPYACSWKAPGAARSTTAQAKAYDGRGNVGSSSLLTITVR